MRCPEPAAAAIIVARTASLIPLFAGDGFSLFWGLPGAGRGGRLSKPNQKSPVRVAAGLPPANPATFHIDKRADAILNAPASHGDPDELLTTAQVMTRSGSKRPVLLGDAISPFPIRAY